MQIDGTTIYWLTRLDSIETLGASLVAIGLVSLAGALIAGAMLRSDGYDEEVQAGKALHRACKRWVWMIPAFGALLATFVPSTKEAAAILVIPAIANSENVQGLGVEVIDLAREWVRELKPESDK